jgi:hypothetical protein
LSDGGSGEKEEGEEVGETMPKHDGYPTDDELEKVKNWDGIHDPWGLIDFLESIWHWSNWGVEKKKSKTELLKRPCIKFYLHTGGWSGNESIIEVLRSNFFWRIFWVSSRRGGHYEFEIPLDWGKN